MQDGILISLGEAELIVRNMGEGSGMGWKCCGGPHTAYPKGNPHGHAVNCPIKPLHNLLEPEMKYGYEGCGEPAPWPERGVQHPVCRKPKGHDGDHTYM